MRRFDIDNGLVEYSSLVLVPSTSHFTMGEKPAMMKMAVDDRPSLSRQAMDNHWRQKQAIDEQQQQDLKISSSTTPGHIKYLVIVCCILVYFLLPLPAV